MIPPLLLALASALPSLECVELIRSARLAEELAQAQTALERRVEANELCPEALAPKLELLSYFRRHGRVEEAQAVRRSLTAWLAQPQRKLEPGALGYLASYPGLERDELAALLDALASRLDQVPGTPTELATAAQLAQNLGRREQARALYGRLLAREPSLHVRHACVDLDRSLGRWEEAARGLEAILATGEPNPFVPMAYLEALARLGRHEELLPRLEGLRQKLDREKTTLVQPSLHTLERRIAWDLRDLGLDEPSERLFRGISARHPQDAEAKSAVLHYYASEEERLAQQRSLEERWAVEMEPYEFLERGIELLARGAAAEAVELLRRAAAALPDSETAWYNLGLAAFELEQWNEAERALDRAGELNPGRAATPFNRGTALAKLNRCSEAVPVLEHALVLDPQLFEAHYYLYACHSLLGNKKQSDEALRRYESAR